MEVQKERDSLPARRWLIALAAAIAVAIAAAVAWPRLADRLRASALYRAAAALAARPFNGRLQDMPHVPRPVKRGGTGGEDLLLRAAASRVLQDSPNAALRGRALLFAGDAAAAAAELERAANGVSQAAFPDLAAAPLEEAGPTG